MTVHRVENDENSKCPRKFLGDGDEALEIARVGDRWSCRGMVSRGRSKDMVRFLARYTTPSFPHRLVREKKGKKIGGRTEFPELYRV